MGQGQSWCCRSHRITPEAAGGSRLHVSPDRSERTKVLSKSPRQSNTTLLSHIDCPGGGQVWVEGTTLYVGNMRPTSGTTIIDVADPRAPRVIAKVAVRDGWHSHKVRVSGDIMIVNQEKFGKSSASDIGGGIDISMTSRPRRCRFQYRRSRCWDLMLMAVRSRR